MEYSKPAVFPDGQHKEEKATKETKFVPEVDGESADGGKGEAAESKPKRKRTKKKSSKK